MFEYALTKGQYEKLHEPDKQSEAEVHTAEIIPAETPISDVLDSSFMVRGSCRDLPPKYMFGLDVSEIVAAKMICRDCVVVESCLEYALNKKLNHGVWGGKSERERLKILKIRRTERLANE